jgi:Sulfotransferase family
MRLRHFLPPTYRELRRSHVAFLEPANLAVMWSYKAACTTVIKWVFQHNGLLPEALAYSSWIHKYRLRRYQKSDRYLTRLKGLASGKFDVVKVVRDPLDRAVSSYIHAYRTGYDDEAIAKVIQRSLTRKQRFSFREFVTFLEASDLRYCNPHHRVQVAPIERHALFGTKPRTIIRIEQGLTAALSELERSLGLPATDFTSDVFSSDHHTLRAHKHGPAADLIQLSPKALPPASMFYDADLSARVMRLYAEDFRQYGYSTDVPQPADAQDGDRKAVEPAVRQAQL